MTIAIAASAGFRSGSSSMMPATAAMPTLHDGHDQPETITTQVDRFWLDVIAPSSIPKDHGELLKNSTTTTQETTTTTPIDQIWSDVVALKPNNDRNLHDDAMMVNSTSTKDETAWNTNKAYYIVTISTYDELYVREPWRCILLSPFANYPACRTLNYRTFNLPCLSFRGVNHPVIETEDSIMTAERLRQEPLHTTSANIPSSSPPRFKAMKMLRVFSIVYQAMLDKSMSVDDYAQQQGEWWTEEEEEALGTAYMQLFVVVACCFGATFGLGVWCAWSLFRCQVAWLTGHAKFPYVLVAVLIYHSATSVFVGLVVCERLYRAQWASCVCLKLIAATILIAAGVTCYITWCRYEVNQYETLLYKASRNRFLIGEALVDRLRAHHDTIFQGGWTFRLKEANVSPQGTFSMLVSVKCSRTYLEEDRVFLIHDIVKYYGEYASAFPLDLECGYYFDLEHSTPSSPIYKSYYQTPPTVKLYRAPPIIDMPRNYYTACCDKTTPNIFESIRSHAPSALLCSRAFYRCGGSLYY
jgi:hypothetical protein